MAESPNPSVQVPFTTVRPRAAGWSPVAHHRSRPARRANPTTPRRANPSVQGSCGPVRLRAGRAPEPARRPPPSEPDGPAPSEPAGPAPTEPERAGFFRDGAGPCGSGRSGLERALCPNCQGTSDITAIRSPGVLPLLWRRPPGTSALREVREARGHPGNGAGGQIGTSKGRVRNASGRAGAATAHEFSPSPPSVASRAGAGRGGEGDDRRSARNENDGPSRRSRVVRARRSGICARRFVTSPCRPSESPAGL